VTEKIIIAIDGYSGCGKSTTAKLVASEVEYKYIDTGAIFRASTLHFLQNHVNITNPKAISKALEGMDISFRFNEKLRYSETYLNGLRVEKEIRSMEVSKRVSQVSALAEVRKEMVAKQHRMGEKKGVVMDGRDIGTTVFPHAELKVFMKADLEVRALRRRGELTEKGHDVDFEEILDNLRQRDHIDTTREESPLRQAEDAYELDTTNLTIENQVQVVLNLFNTLMKEKNQPS
jgi:cytidylate kinase